MSIKVIRPLVIPVLSLNNYHRPSYWYRYYCYYACICYLLLLLLQSIHYNYTPITTISSLRMIPILSSKTRHCQRYYYYSASSVSFLLSSYVHIRQQQQHQRRRSRQWLQPRIVSSSSFISNSQQYSTRPNDHDTYDNNNMMKYTTMDEYYLQMAVQYAKLGYGYTFPNPALGCVIVLHTNNNDTNTNTNDNNQEDKQEGNSSSNINSNNNDIIIGCGYHPKSGYPHAEIFALFQAAKHIPSGISGANAVIQHYFDNNNNNVKTNKNKNKDIIGSSDPDLYETIATLTKKYQSPDGAKLLFENCLQQYYQNTTNNNNDKITISMYVTLEPCCHIGKRTPPCTNTILLCNGISRLVIGTLDPNPNVDGNGQQQILISSSSTSSSTSINTQHEQQPSSSSNPITIVTIPNELYEQNGTAPYNCQQIIQNFAKRITYTSSTTTTTESIIINGRIKRGLRTLANQLLVNHTLCTLSWDNSIVNGNDHIDMDEIKNSTNSTTINQTEVLYNKIHEMTISPVWMEQLDGLLWENELVLLRLNKAISKRKGTTILGQRIASLLYANVVQTKGHTVLLYRPSYNNTSSNSSIDLNQYLNSNHLIEDNDDDDNDDEN